MNDHDRATLNEINRLVDEGQPASNDFLNELIRTKPVATAKVKARLEDRLMSTLSERKRAKMNANGHFDLSIVRHDEDLNPARPRRRSRTSLPLTMAATLLMVILAGLLLVVISADGPRGGGGQSRSEMLTQSPTDVGVIEPTRILTQYTVQEGDTCGSIADMFTVQVENLAAVNGIAADCSTLRVGQELMIPLPVVTATPIPTATPTDVPRGPAPGFPPPQTPLIVFHTVRAGETCQSIALLYHIPEADIIAANDVEGRCDELEAGQHLEIWRRYYTPTPYQTRTPVVSTDGLLAVVIAREELQVGTTISAESVALVYYPRELVPQGAFSELHLAIGRVVTRTIPQYVPIVVDMAQLSVDCPFRLSISEAVLVADQTLENALNNALPEFVEVYTDSRNVGQSGACVTDEELLAVNYRIQIPTFAFMTDEEVLEAIVYAFPDTHLPTEDNTGGQYGTITINYGEDGDSKMWTFGLIDLFDARERNLHGQDLMDALGLDLRINAQLNPTFAPPVTATPTVCPEFTIMSAQFNNAQNLVEVALSDVLPVTVEIRVSGFYQGLVGPCPDTQSPYEITYRLTTPPIDGMTNEDIIETIIYAFPDEQLPANDPQLGNGELYITISGESSAPTWQLSLDDIADIRQRDLHGAELISELDNQMVECPSPSLLTRHLANAENAVEDRLYYALPDSSVEVSVSGFAHDTSVACPGEEGPFTVNFDLNLTPIEGMTDEEIIQTILYGFPSPQLPVNNPLVWDGNLTITIGDGPNAPRWRINLVYLTVVTRRGLRGTELMAEMEDLSVAASAQPSGIPTIDPTVGAVITPIGPTPTDCPPASTPERSLDPRPMQDALTAALQTPVEVSAMGFQNCPGVTQASIASYTVIVPQIEGMSDAELVETLVYAVPDEDLALPGLITIRISDRTSLGFSLDIDAVRNARLQNLHGQELMDALGLDLPISISLVPDQVGVDVGLSGELAATVAPGDRLTLRFAGVDFDAVCNPRDDAPQLIQQECESAFRSFNTRTISFTAPSLTVVALQDNEAFGGFEGQKLATLAADPATAEAISWLTGHGTIYTFYIFRDNGAAETNVTWHTAGCPSSEEVQAVLDGALAAMQTTLDAAFIDEVVVSLGAVETCPDLSRQFGIWYQVDVPSRSDMSNAEIIQTVVYAMPYELLPQDLFSVPFGGVTIAIGTDENLSEYSLDLNVLKRARDGGLGGQDLMDALEVEIMAE